MKIRWLVLGLVVVALLTPALMITSARLVEPGGVRWVRLVSFTPYAVVFYALAMLLLLVAFAAGSGLWRGASGLLCLLISPLLVLHLLWAGGPYVGATAAAADSATTFTVMSSNLHRGKADAVRVLDLARENDVDILVLTEITTVELRRLRGAGLGKAFGYSAGDPASGVTGTMVFSAYRLSEVQPLSTVSHGYAITVRLRGRAIRLLAVHPQPPKEDAGPWRADHVAVRRAAGAVEGPTLIAGDFNATLDHAPMRELEARGFEDAAEQANSGWQPTWPSGQEVTVFSFAVPPLFAIDHVLVTEELVAVDTETATVRGTDHRAVIARLAFR